MYLACCASHLVYVGYWEQDRKLIRPEPAHYPCAREKVIANPVLNHVLDKESGVYSWRSPLRRARDITVQRYAAVEGDPGAQPEAATASRHLNIKR